MKKLCKGVVGQNQRGLDFGMLSTVWKVNFLFQLYFKIIVKEKTNLPVSSSLKSSHIPHKHLLKTFPHYCPQSPFLSYSFCTSPPFFSYLPLFLFYGYKHSMSWHFLPSHHPFLLRGFSFPLRLAVHRQLPCCPPHPSATQLC